MLVTLVVELLRDSLPNQELLKMSLPLPFSLSLPTFAPVQLNADPLASISQPARTPVVGASSAQPRQKRSRISTLSQLASVAVAQPASGTTSTVAVGNDDDEE